MSGEYYNTTNDGVNKFYQGLESKVTTRESNRCQGNKLTDIEEQLEMAEYRCNSLKDQLDNMKSIYGIKKQTKSRKISNLTATITSTIEDEIRCSTHSVEGKSKTSHFPKKQISNSISTDSSGAAVRTINNILNGITNSVNRLSEMQVQVKENACKSEQTSPRLTLNLMNLEENVNIPKKDAVNETNGSVKISTRSKNIKRKPKETKILGKKSAAYQANKRNDKKLKSCTGTRASGLDKLHSTTFTRSKIKASMTPKKRISGNLVELYHNLAAKQSNSDEGNLGAKYQSQQIREDIPMLQIVETDEECDRGETKIGIKAGARRHAQTDYDPPTQVVSCYSKNYELPTIASRLKQVAKSYLHNFTFKAIPFCAAISTSPSHNIGINIQQVMNIIKTRQPLNGISPTLAHNIGLAAEKLNSKPLSTLISTINSRMSCKPSQCPLSKSMLTYHQLQEMARGIPEETPQELEDDLESPHIKTIMITGPSGDMEVKTRSGPCWAADSMRSEQCTCIQQSGVDIQHVVNKYRKPAANQRNKNWYKKNSRSVQNKGTSPSLSITSNAVCANQTDGVVSNNRLQGNEKNLKSVLMNLHNEFEKLNNRYEYLCQNATCDDADTVKELEELEKELNKKEDEITMVMALYKEVVALKQQVKILKEKTSQASIPNKKELEESSNYKDYTHPRAAVHLTKLLKQIQLYQMKYKKRAVEM